MNVTQARAERFDAVDFIMSYEAGELDEQAVITGFQHLIDSGLAWTLQGHYGRMATRLIEDGQCAARRA